ncbi:MAG TPA: AEC family transporter [Paenalcaligenes sp.]|nr:AEC family transporter [Paenalcaligenes sp.]
MLHTFGLILPDVFLVLVGWLLFRSQWLSREFFNHTEKLVYYVFFPALLFQSVTDNPLSLQQITTLGLASWLLVLGGIALSFLAFPVLRPSANKYHSIAQCSYRFNTYIALSIAFAVGSQAGLGIMAIYVALTVPVVNFAAVYTLAQNSNSRVLSAVLKNPLILSTLAGFAWNATGLSIPGPVGMTLSRLGASALPLGLICVGASLSLQAIHGAKMLIGWVTATRLLIMPIFALLINLWLPLSPLEKQMLLLFACVPPATASYVLAVRMGGNGQLVALTLSISTLLAALTLPMWMMINYL